MAPGYWVTGVDRGGKMGAHLVVRKLEDSARSVAADVRFFRHISKHDVDEGVLHQGEEHEHCARGHEHVDGLGKENTRTYYKHCGSSLGGQNTQICR